MTGSGEADHTPEKYKVEMAVTWTLVSIPLVYGIYNTIVQVSQIFTG